MWPAESVGEWRYTSSTSWLHHEGKSLILARGPEPALGSRGVRWRCSTNLLAGDDLNNRCCHYAGYHARARNGDRFSRERNPLPGCCYDDVICSRGQD